jgi:hypothetical protein
VWEAVVFESYCDHKKGFDYLHRDGWAIATHNKSFSHHCESLPKEADQVGGYRSFLKGRLNKKSLSLLYPVDRPLR